ncbi:DUF2000 domain-containing protein [Solicola gregarius]|uniref:DUF2000 domain-containing protein n=1 Tax=Solicola gregarius TaxID=2908642 RepID=A0AA46TFU1_9ACTN|nr:DUF2000 domain-containing protein [Solicola gregarius]UYM04567.1 DUF2000 domain-containing protein [Solicola gregarius]
MEKRFDTKITVILRDDLQAWQTLNVTAFLTSGIAAANPEIIGEPYEDGDGNTYYSMFRQPVVVLQGDSDAVKTAHERCLRRGLRTAVYTSDMFTTGNDDDNRAVVRAVDAEKLDLVGIAVHGPRNAVDKIAKGCHMHP